MMTFSSIEEEYEQTGMVRQSFSLADPNILPALRQDALSFQKAVQALSGQGKNRVPYFFTPALKQIACDQAIVGVIKSILGKNQPWVVWGANIQQGTPNEAYCWHVDMESFYWPTITVVIGLENCTENNATRCIPYSQNLDYQPSTTCDNSDDHCTKTAANFLDKRCDSICTFEHFGVGKFYVFNAKTWHCGPNLANFQDRKLVILHYQDASHPRIPYMCDYENQLWFSEPAEFIVGSDLCSLSNPLEKTFPQSNHSLDNKIRTDLYPLPKGHRQLSRRSLPGRLMNLFRSL